MLIPAYMRHCFTARVADTLDRSSKIEREPQILGIGEFKSDRFIIFYKLVETEGPG